MGLGGKKTPANFRRITLEKLRRSSALGKIDFSSKRPSFHWTPNPKSRVGPWRFKGPGVDITLFIFERVQRRVFCLGYKRLFFPHAYTPRFISCDPPTFLIVATHRQRCAMNLFLPVFCCISSELHVLLSSS